MERRAATMRAYCQHCDRSEQIAPEEIYSPEFNFWCPRCQNILILQDDGEGAPDELGARQAQTKTDDEPPPVVATSAAEPSRGSPALTTPSSLPPALPRGPTAAFRELASAPLLGGGTADGAPDPYDTLAAELGRGIISDELLRPTTRVPRGETNGFGEEPRTWADGEAPRPDPAVRSPAPAPPPTRTDDEAPVPPARETVRVTRASVKASLSEAIAPDLPPLPNWDGGDTQQVQELARHDPAGPTAIPLADPTRTADAPPAAEDARQPDALDEIAVVEPKRGTMGLGSRTYEKAPEFAPSDAPGTQTAAAGAPEGHATSAGATEGSRPEASPEDLDWFALIDEALPEMTGPEAEDDASRVVIRLPEAMAPQSEADAEQLKQLQATLEARGLGHDTHPALRLDPKKLDGASDRSAAHAEADDTRDDFKKVDPDAPTAIHDPAATAAIRAELGDDTITDAARLARVAHEAPRTQTGRSARPKPAHVVEQFTRADLDPALVCARDSSSPEADCFKQLYQRVFHERRNGVAPRTVLVTSATRGEGRTTVAGNLAVVAARMPGRGALLVEADPRGGDVLKSFGVHFRTEGLLEALQNGKDPLDYVIEFKLGMLDVLPLGVPGSDAAELLSSDRIGEVLAKLAARYPNAAIIVDGSSVLHAPDPLVLARHVDGVILVVRADQTPREHVERACQLIGPEKILGVVLNHASAVAVG